MWSRRSWLRAPAAIAWVVLALAVAAGCSTAAESAKPAEGAKPVAAPPAKSAEAVRQEAADRAEARRHWVPPRFISRQAERNAMVRLIERYGLTDKTVLGVMAAVPRHEFVPDRLSASAYADTPLPIGHSQTISQPYIVAEMTAQLRLRSDSKVLEIGTGSGYQAAVLAHITPHVYTIEIVKPLAEAAEARLRRLGYDVVEVRCGDGYEGWPEAAPFDAIIGTCVAGKVPPPLIEQLKAGGRMVIPIGEENAIQRLMLIEKDAAGKVRKQSLMPVRFVPLLRKDPTAK